MDTDLIKGINQDLVAEDDPQTEELLSVRITKQEEASSSVCDQCETPVKVYL